MPVHRRRLVSLWRSSRIVSLVAIAVLVSLAVVATMPSGRHQVVSQRDANLATQLTDSTTEKETASRRIYPYSIVAGGVQSPTEVMQAVADDPTVAAHYAGIDSSRLRVDHVSGTPRAYVSYRRGGQVYWTSHAIALHDGEAILTDGVTTLRARCGNMLSDTPQQPVALDEPDLGDFELIDDPGDGRLLDAIFMSAGPSLLGAPPLTVLPENNGPGVFTHGPEGTYFAGLGLSDPVDPAVDPGVVISGPVISPFPPIDELPITSVLVPGPSTTSHLGPGLSAEAYLMGFGAIDPGDPAFRSGDPGDPAFRSGDIIDDPGITSRSPIDEQPITPVPVPEPGTIALVGLGLAAIVRHARQRLHKDQNTAE